MPADKNTPAVGYVLRKFPVLSETFILNEILALEAHGVPVQIFSLQRPSDPRFHEDLAKLKASVYYAPEISDLKAVLRQNKLASQRYGQSYRSTFARTLKGTRPRDYWRFLQACYIANQARRFQLTHIHAHFANYPASVAMLASQISGIPYSFTAHAMDIFKEEVNKKTLAKKITEAKFVATVSEFNKSYLEEIASGQSEKIVRIYNGINLERFSPYGSPSIEPFTFLCVARLVEKKGHALLLEACRTLRDNQVPFRCRIVGKGNLRSQLDSFIKDSKLQKEVQLLGPKTQREVLEEFRSSHVSVLPCTTGSDGNKDGLPVSVVEALACGLPVITTPMTGIPEVVQDGHNGFLVADGDATALADAMESVVRDTELFNRLRAQARSSVASRFDMKQTSQELRRLMVEV